jgi:hypothetical protein
MAPKRLSREKLAALCDARAARHGKGRAAMHGEFLILIPRRRGGAPPPPSPPPPRRHAHARLRAAALLLASSPVRLSRPFLTVTVLLGAGDNQAPVLNLNDVDAVEEEDGAPAPRLRACSRRCWQAVCKPAVAACALPDRLTYVTVPRHRSTSPSHSADRRGAFAVGCEPRGLRGRLQRRGRGRHTRRLYLFTVSCFQFVWCFVCVFVCLCYSLI